MDNLKIINDRFGHDHGDISLKAVGKILQEALGETVVIGRIGGDEFAVLGFGEKNCSQKAREQIAITNRKYNEQSELAYYVNISIGIYEFELDGTCNLWEALDKADDSLYTAKKNRRKEILKVE